MRARRRRRLDAALLVVAAAATGGIAAFGAAVYNEERIDQMWVGAALRDDGLADVHEVIDDNFGNATGRHGLERRVPGLTTSSPLSAYSPDGAPDGIASLTPFRFDDGVDGVQIRIGDPARTVSGRHRYVLDYQLDTLGRGNTVAWDAVGTGWSLKIEEVQAHLVAPYELEDPVCQRGREGSTDECPIREVEPGHLVAVATGLDPGHGMTIRATRGAPLAAAPVLPATDIPLPSDDGAGIAQPAALALVGALGAAGTVSPLVRRAGRERVGAGGAADAAFHDLSGTTSERLVDLEELADLATTDFAPPEGISPALGGVVHDEEVRPNHKVAWLLERAIEGSIELKETEKSVRLTRLAPGEGEAAELLDKAFGGRSSFHLGQYDKKFATAWSALSTALQRDAKASGFWDPDADRRTPRVRALGLLAMVLGLVAVGGGAAMARRHDATWLVVVAIGSLLVGGGFAALLRGWELRVRTPAGSAMWLRVESFRRFLEHSEAYHAEEAAKRGVLREYTAWAVAVGEIDRWRRAVESSTVIPDTPDLRYVALAPVLHSSTSTASTAPSSSGSGSGGFGGGGVGGGGGGGGGGNW